MAPRRTRKVGGTKEEAEAPVAQVQVQKVVSPAKKQKIESDAPAGGPLHAAWIKFEQLFNTKDAKMLSFNHINMSEPDEKHNVVITLAINTNVWSQTVKVSDHKKAKKNIADACLAHYGLSDPSELEIIELAAGPSPSGLLGLWLEDKHAFSISAAPRAAKEGKTVEGALEFHVALNVNSKQAGESKVALSKNDIPRCRDLLAVEYLSTEENSSAFVKFLSNRQNMALMEAAGIPVANGNGAAVLVKEEQSPETKALVTVTTYSQLFGHKQDYTVSDNLGDTKTPKFESTCSCNGVTAKASSANKKETKKLAAVAWIKAFETKNKCSVTALNEEETAKRRAARNEKAQEKRNLKRKADN